MNVKSLSVVAAALMSAAAGAGEKEFDSVRIVLRDGTAVMTAAGAGEKATLAANPAAARLSERTARTVLNFPEVAMGGLKGSLARIAGPGYATWTFALANESATNVTVKAVEFFRDWAPKGATDGEIVGNTDGAVAVFPSARTFVGVENPLAKVSVEGGKATGVLPREYAIGPGETWNFRWTVGTYAEGQLRRDFHAYLNRERAHPYRVLPHYNSWYDLGIFRSGMSEDKRMNETEALKVMVDFREELSKRGVSIDSYLWDDGWDRWDSLWEFHKGFPNGFRKLADEAHKVKGASIGCWMSPCGGYGRAWNARCIYARTNGVIRANEGLLRMSAPTYYKAFRDRVVKMITDYDANLFKFDRMGVGRDCDGADTKCMPDMEAVVRLIGEMRAAKPDVFVNATVGTWASPYWVMLADSIWRGGEDYGTVGEGSVRQKWITYRDNVIHDRFAVKSPLYPLNSIMFHGLIVSSKHLPGKADNSDKPAATRDFADEVWMSVGCGTDLQEYYITTSMMHPAWWDILADGIKWLKANQDVLVDSHWIGGDPQAPSGAEVYGYAAWAPKDGGSKGIVLLRNPSAEGQEFTATLAELLELVGAPAKAKVVDAKTVYSHDVAFKAPKTAADKVEFAFDPFGLVLVEFAFGK